jgi:hypothetical protein
MSEKNINAPCRERSNESNIMGRCMRCSAELGKACGAASSCCSAGGEEEPAMNKIVGPRGWTPGNLERRFTETHPSSYDKKMRCSAHCRSNGRIVRMQSWRAWCLRGFYPTDLDRSYMCSGDRSAITSTRRRSRGFQGSSGRSAPLSIRSLRGQFVAAEEGCL